MILFIIYINHNVSWKFCVPTFIVRFEGSKFLPVESRVQLLWPWFWSISNWNLRNRLDNQIQGIPIIGIWTSPLAIHLNEFSYFFFDETFEMVFMLFLRLVDKILMNWEKNQCACHLVVWFSPTPHFSSFIINKRSVPIFSLGEMVLFLMRFFAPHCPHTLTVLHSAVF